MDRIISPLRKMRAKIYAQDGKYPPLTIRGKKLQAISYKLPVASAQVKSCILLAGLLAEGTTQVIEPRPSRDHTERMLDYLGANITREDNAITVNGRKGLKGNIISIPADFSSASFFLAAGAVVKDAKIKVMDVGINPTRTGFLTMLKRMGAQIDMSNEKILNQEPRANITVKSCDLEGTEISTDLIPLLIDEIPLIAILATQASGTTIIKGAKEARVKETDRIKSTVENLKKMGAEVEERPDGMLIEGKQTLKGGIVKSYGDHRMAMAFTVAGLMAEGTTMIQDAQWVQISYPNFYQDLKELLA
jgi:3-phosphoshikimate 1-carboxyvinyltransferase